MKGKRLYELGILAQEGNEDAMLEIINRKKARIQKITRKAQKRNNKN